MNLKLAIFIVTFYLEIVQSANILGYLITNKRSHFIVADALMRGLAEKGHNVSLYILYPTILNETESKSRLKNKIR